MKVNLLINSVWSGSGFGSCGLVIFFVNNKSFILDVIIFVYFKSFLFWNVNLRVVGIVVNNF